MGIPTCTMYTYIHYNSIVTIYEHLHYQCNLGLHYFEEEEKQCQCFHNKMQQSVVSDNPI